MRNERSTPRPRVANSRLSCLCAATLLIVLPGPISLVGLTSGGRGANSAVPHFVEAAIGNNDTPLAWAGYGPHPQDPSSGADPDQLDGLQAWLRSGDVASVDGRDSGGNTSLLLAASSGDTAVVQALLARKAKVSLVNAQGISPLEAALRQGHGDVARLLRTA